MMAIIQPDPSVTPDAGLAIHFADGTLLVRANTATHAEQRRFAERIVHDLRQRDQLSVQVAQLETEVGVLRAKLEGMRALIQAGEALLCGLPPAED